MSASIRFSPRAPAANHHRSRKVTIADMQTSKKTAEVCTKKIRHADEATARAAGMLSITKNQNVDALYVYRCTVCRGWHLTRFQVGAPIVASDPVYEPSPKDQVLAILDEGEITSHIGIFAKTKEQAWIHRMCLQLEQDGKAVRVRESQDSITWMAAPAAK